MEKDALLEIVLHDMKEVETLVKSFKGKTNLSPAFFKLTRKKMQSILEEIEMLEELADAPAESRNVTTGHPLQKEDSDLQGSPSLTESTPKVEEPDDQPNQEPLPNAEIADSTGDLGKEGETASNEQGPEEKPETATPEEQPLAHKEEEPTEAHAPENEPSQEEPPPTGISETSPKEESRQAPPKDHKVLGEKLNTGKSSYNEQIGKKATNGASRRMITKPVSDLRKALGINDRFYYQRELFGGSADLLNQTLDQLNEMGSMADARHFLLSNFNWDSENEAVVSFLDFVERRFL